MPRRSGIFCRDIKKMEGDAADELQGFELCCIEVQVMGARFMKVVKSARRGRNLAKKFKKRLSAVLVAFGVLLFGSAWLVWYQEMHFQGAYHDAVWTVLFTLIGQGEFATNPKTIPGRVIVFVLSIVGVALLGVVLSEIVQRLMTSKLREMMGMSRCKYAGHTVICGWNERGRLILKELVAGGKQISIIAAERPASLPSGEIFFIAGSPTDEETLQRAGIAEAATALILADHQSGAASGDVDAKTILVSLAVEAANSDIYSIVELLNPENERYARLAKVDDIIYCDSLIAEVTATCTAYAGISVFMKDILCASDEGHRFAAFDVSREFDGKSVGELFEFFRRDHHALPVGIITPPEGASNAPVSLWRSQINPDENLKLSLPAKAVCILKN
ncbi:MAG: NAD-binding protein [Synergistaceae bacterium]|jgi:voltage-gated potassium channel|nr:NAD-binding protein [Synergistaceae bacterium]